MRSRIPLWDLWCTVSLIGIWPRFIEPKLICTTKLSIKIPTLPKSLQNLKILHFSDLHFQKDTSTLFLSRIKKKISALNPDLIVFTGDFICYGALVDQERLLSFLQSLSAHYGCYACFGNHDYEEAVTINEQGDYDIVSNPSSPLANAFNRLLKTTHLTGASTARAKKLSCNQGLVDLLKKTKFCLLENNTILIPIKNSFLNITGLGEYMLGRSAPSQAFWNYNSNYPGIVLAHNPDSVKYLRSYPGNVVFCGHTHGGQVNLPWMWKKFTLIEDHKYKSGLVTCEDKYVYINRGIGAILPFRWFSPPEITLVTLQGGDHEKPH